MKNDAMELAELIRERPVKATEACEMAQKLFNSKTRGEKAYKFLKDNLDGFGLKSLLTGNNNSRYYGTEEALENLRKTGKTVFHFSTLPPFHPLIFHTKFDTKLVRH